MKKSELNIILENHRLWLELRGGERADLRDADLRGADLRDADLRGAYILGADLRDADLRDADLRGADLRGAYIQGADLRGADLRDADLRDADLRGAYIQGAYIQDAYLRGVKIGTIEVRKIACFSGLYKYITAPIIATDGTEYIQLGCYIRTTEEWKNEFWNNTREFPNNGDIPSKERWLAYQTCLQWLEIHREVKS